MQKSNIRLRKLRENKGLSQEYLALELGISQASYARLENETTKLSIERLYKIAQILETPITEFFGKQNYAIKKQVNKEGAFGNGYVEHLYAENKETQERLLRSKDEIIQQLKAEVAFLRKQLSEKR